MQPLYGISQAASAGTFLELNTKSDSHTVIQSDTDFLNFIIRNLTKSEIKNSK